MSQSEGADRDARLPLAGTPPRLVVIGGGITGLAAAHRALERAREAGAAVEVTVLEERSRAGGVIATEEAQGFLLEGGPDSLITEKPWAIDLCRRIGLGDELIATRSAFQRSLVVKGGRLLPVPLGFSLLAPTRLWPFARSPLLSPLGKLAVLRDLVAPRGGPPPGGDESLASFVVRRLGREVLDRIAQPVVAGIYAADPAVLSLAATMPRFLELERSARSLILGLRRQGSPATRGASGARYGLFVTLRRGMGSLVAELERRLPPGAVRCGVRAVGLARGDGVGAGGWRVALDGGESLRAESVVVAVPAWNAADLVRPVDAELAAQLGAIPYASAATVALGFRREDVPHPLDAFGFVVPAVERRRILACTFASVKYDGRAAPGAVLLRAFVGGALQPECFALDDRAMAAAVREELAALLGVRAEPLFTRIARWPASMPQYAVGHLDRVAAIERCVTRLEGLALAGNAYRGVGVGDCVRSGEAAADALIDSWRQTMARFAAA